MNKKELLMQKLGCSEAEALQIIEDDKKIDKGEKLFELTAEQKKVAKQATSTGTKKHTAYKFDKKSRKENPIKQQIIEEIFKFICENAEFSAESVEILNKERQIAFKVGENDYELTLVQKRKAKKQEKSYFFPQNRKEKEKK